MLPEQLELNKSLLKHVEKALCVELFADQVDSPFLVTEERLSRENGAVYFGWMNKEWRVDDRYQVEVAGKEPGWFVDDSCVLMKLLLKKCGEVAEIKRDLRVVRRRFSDQNGSVFSWETF